MREQINIDIAIRKLTSLLEWSDRLGSDETDEIGLVVKFLYNKDKDSALECLSSLLNWSDRLGSDETHEIGLVVKVLEDN